MRRWLSGFIIAAMGAAGCSVGPDHQPPEGRAPLAWSETLPEGVSDRQSSFASWWRTFGDSMLTALVDEAILSNHDLRIAIVRVRAARSGRTIAAAAGLPLAGSSATYQRFRQSENLGSFAPGGGSPGGFSPSGDPDDFWSAGFDASWEIDVFGGVRRSVEAAEARVEAAEENRRAILVALVAEVARSYVELRGAQRQLAVARASVESQETTLELTRSRFEAGLTGEFDVQRAEAQLAATLSRIPTLEVSSHRSIHRIEVLLGKTPGALASDLAAESPIPPAPPEVPAGLPSELLARRPDLRRAEREVAEACARIGVARADLFPRFFLTGSASLDTNDFSTWGQWDSRSWSLGPRITWPILAAGSLLANVSRFEARHAEALMLYEKAVLEAFEDVENALVSYGREKIRWASLTRAVTANRRALEIAMELYTKGLADFFSVLDTQRSLHASEDELAQSEAAVSKAVMVLYKALGGGWEVQSPPDNPVSRAS